MYRETVRKLVHRLNAESPSELQVRYADLEERLSLANKQGYVIGALDGRMSAVAVLLQRVGDEQLVTGIAGPHDSIVGRCEGLVQELRGAIAHHLSPRNRPAAAPAIERHPISAAG